jgi:hypothetical protein
MADADRGNDPVVQTRRRRRIVVVDRTSSAPISRSITRPEGGDRAIADDRQVAEVIGGDLDDIMGDCSTMGVPRRSPGRGAMDRASRPAVGDASLREQTPWLWAPTAAGRKVPGRTALLASALA